MSPGDPISKQRSSVPLLPAASMTHPIKVRLPPARAEVLLQVSFLQPCCPASHALSAPYPPTPKCVIMGWLKNIRDMLRTPEIPPPGHCSLLLWDAEPGVKTWQGFYGSSSKDKVPGVDWKSEGWQCFRPNGRSSAMAYPLPHSHTADRDRQGPQRSAFRSDAPYFT